MNVARKRSGGRKGRPKADVCACGCGEPLAKPHKPSLQRLFRQGHDARLKSLVLRKKAGERVRIPAVAVKMAPQIPFLRRPEFAGVIAAR